MSAMPIESSQLALTSSSSGYVSAGEDLAAWADKAQFGRTLHPADWLNGVKDQIQKLDRLQPNWDSYGAAPISAKSIRQALRLAEQISRYDSIEAPNISATPDGIVAFGWDVGDWSLDAEIEPDGQIVYACLDEREGECDHEGIFPDWLQFAEFLSYTFLSLRKK